MSLETKSILLRETVEQSLEFSMKGLASIATSLTKLEIENEISS
jgi:hypothetical protein